MTDPLASAKFAMHAEAYHILLSYVGVDTLNLPEPLLAGCGVSATVGEDRAAPTPGWLMNQERALSGEWQVLQEFMLIIPDCRNAGGCARQKVRNCKH